MIAGVRFCTTIDSFCSLLFSICHTYLTSNCFNQIPSQALLYCSVWYSGLGLRRHRLKFSYKKSNMAQLCMPIQLSFTVLCIRGKQNTVKATICRVKKLHLNSFICQSSLSVPTRRSVQRSRCLIRTHRRAMESFRVKALAATEKQLRQQTAQLTNFYHCGTNACCFHVSALLCSVRVGRFARKQRLKKKKTTDTVIKLELMLRKLARETAKF